MPDKAAPVIDAGLSWYPRCDQEQDRQLGVVSREYPHYPAQKITVKRGTLTQTGLPFRERYRQQKTGEHEKDRHPGKTYADQWREIQRHAGQDDGEIGMSGQTPDMVEKHP